MNNLPKSNFQQEIAGQIKLDTNFDTCPAAEPLARCKARIQIWMWVIHGKNLASKLTCIIPYPRQAWRCVRGTNRLRLVFFFNTSSWVRFGGNLLPSTINNTPLDILHIEGRLNYRYFLFLSIITNLKKTLYRGRI
jgi:hypothetical protein